MKVRSKSHSQNQIKNQAYFSDESEQDEQHLRRKAESAYKEKKQSPKDEDFKRQSANFVKRSTSKPAKINNNMEIKLESSDVRFIEKIVQEKHGKILTHEQMTSLKKKMVRENFNESNPYNELNYNTGQRNEWRDNTKKHLSQEDLAKFKKHFLHVNNIANKGEKSRYTLRDMKSQFNLDEPAFLQLKRHFENDPETNYFLNKHFGNSDMQESSQISQIVKKRSILNKILLKNPLLSISQLYQKISRHTKSDSYFPEFQIQKLLEDEGYNHRPIVQYPESRNFQKNLERKKKFCEEINYILTETTFNVYFFGVFNFNSFMFRTEGWTKEEYLISPTIQDSFSLVALTQRSGQGTWKFEKQIYKQQVFSQTCRILFEQLLPETFEPKYIAIDFRLQKYQKVIKNSRYQNDIEIIWIPPFSYNLNPLEFWFEDIKRSLGKSENIVQLQEPLELHEKKSEFLMKDIFNDLKKIFSEKYNEMFDFGGFFEMAAVYHKKALEMTPI